MAVRFNENKELVAKIQEGLKKKDGYCPCRLQNSRNINVSVKNLSNRLQTLNLKDTAIVNCIINLKIKRGCGLTQPQILFHIAYMITQPH